MSPVGERNGAPCSSVRSGCTLVCSTTTSGSTTRTASPHSVRQSGQSGPSNEQPILDRSHSWIDGQPSDEMPLASPRAMESPTTSTLIEPLHVGMLGSPTSATVRSSNFSALPRSRPVPGPVLTQGGRVGAVVAAPGPVAPTTVVGTVDVVVVGSARRSRVLATRSSAVAVRGTPAHSADAVTANTATPAIPRSAGRSDGRRAGSSTQSCSTAASPTDTGSTTRHRSHTGRPGPRATTSGQCTR